MTRTMYDAVTLANCPRDGALYGCYVDGAYANEAEARRRFPHARIVTITVTGRAGANVCDCETGDLSPASAAQWAAREVHAGRHPTIYTNTSTWPAVKAAVAATELKPGQVTYWIAHYDGVAEIPAGAVAKQYLGDYHGYDKSVVADYWPGVDPAPTPPKPKPATPPAPTPAPVREDDMPRLVKGTGPKVYITNDIHCRHVEDPAERDDLIKRYGPVQPIPDAHLARLADVTHIGH